MLQAVCGPPSGPNSNGDYDLAGEAAQGSADMGRRTGLISEGGTKVCGEGETFVPAG